MVLLVVLSYDCITEAPWVFRLIIEVGLLWYIEVYASLGDQWFSEIVTCFLF